MLLEHINHEFFGVVGDILKTPIRGDYDHVQELITWKWELSPAPIRAYNSDVKRFFIDVMK